jgi:hypothetical protein
MAANKASTRRDSRSLPSTPPPRLASYTRVKSPLQRTDERTEIDEPAAPPSTLPPPPFSHEMSVQGLEWWLEAHMGLAADLAWLQQLLDADLEGESPEAWRRVAAHADTVRRLGAHADSVRDALYELYCDASDDRVGGLLGSGAPLEQHVRCIYEWCRRVLAMLGALVNSLRAGGPDWAVAKSQFRSASAMYVGRSEALRAAIAELAIDTSSPVEPLRTLPGDLEVLFDVTGELQGALSKRFA